MFSNTEFGNLGILTINGKEFFPATRCAKLLGYADPNKAIKQHCKSDGWVKRPGVTYTTNQFGTTTQQITDIKYITEGNLYRLIVSSKLPSAERFERWIFDEVLPSIRKNGGYNSVQAAELMNRVKMLEAAVATLTEDLRRIQREDVLMLTEKECVECIECRNIAQLPPHIRTTLNAMIDNGRHTIGHMLDFLEDNHIWIPHSILRGYIRKRKT